MFSSQKNTLLKQPIHVSNLYHIMNSNAIITWFDNHGEYNGYKPNETNNLSKKKLPSDKLLHFINWVIKINNKNLKIHDAENSLEKTSSAFLTSDLIIINPYIQNHEIVSTPASLIHSSVLQDVFKKIGYSWEIPFCNYVAIDFCSDEIKEKKKLTPLLNGKDVRHFKTTFESSQRILDGLQINNNSNGNFLGGLLIDNNWSSENSSAFRYYLYNCNHNCSYENALQSYHYIINHPEPCFGKILELCPNMNINNSKWSKCIQEISIENSEITLIYKCTTKIRQTAWELGVHDFHGLLSISDKINLPSISSKIIWANHRDNLFPIITPRKLKQKNNLTMLTEIEDCPWFTCDFETINEDGKLWIFMITTSISVGNKFIKIQTNTMESLTSSEQIRILNDWMNWMKEELLTISDVSLEKVNIFHWSNAEKAFLKNCINQYELEKQLETDLNNIKWYDVCEVFKKEEIVIPGAFNYKLKNVAEALLKQKKINHTWDDDVKNGFVAMQLALENYKSKKRCHSVKKHFLTRIQKYNENDVLVLEDIVHFLKTMK